VEQMSCQGKLEKERGLAANVVSYEKHFWIRRAFFWWFLKPFGLCMSFLYLTQFGFCREILLTGLDFL
jgi:phosphatidylserine decarboxylase